MPEIFKVGQQTGQPGRPKEVEVLGANWEKASTPEIVGAKVPTEPKIVDRTTKDDE